MRALITGINGFVGGHLAEHVLRQGWQVAGLGLAGEIGLATLRGRVEVVSADLLDRDATYGALAATRPDVIFHLAAQSHVPTAFADPATTITNNLFGQLNLLEAVRALALDALLVVACTSEEYGAVRPEELPVDEQTPLRPSNPYAFSKVAQDMLALQYFLAYGTRTVRLRLFNHIGPRQGDHFVVGAFAHQIAAIEAGRQPPVVRVGNLEARRDFTDVRDVVRAYELAALKGEPGAVYNIGSGRPVAIREILATLIELSAVAIAVEPDPERMRPVDIPVIACDASCFRARTGWTPEISLERSLADILDDWRERIRDA
jgi:GDP-4-dehydro-6-deoxy-D-mannose reductase